MRGSAEQRRGAQAASTMGHGPPRGDHLAPGPRKGYRGPPPTMNTPNPGSPILLETPQPSGSW